MFERTILIDEIFKSINGETSMSGTPTVFVRTVGCNIHCSYCDTIQDKTDRFLSLTPSEILAKIEELNCKNVCITGGEPLIQENIFSLIHLLTGRGYNVYIETNGSIEISEVRNRRHRFIMDVKCPSSREEDKMLLRNLGRLSREDEVKFVIADRWDFDYALKVLKEFPTIAHLLFSPMFGEDNKQNIAKDLVEWLLESDLENYRIQLQIHKIIGVS